MASKRKPKDTAADGNERLMGAVQYILDKYGRDWDTSGHKTPREFVNSGKDVISESNIGDLYPENVWSKAADKVLMGVWSRKRNKMKIARK